MKHIIIALMIMLMATALVADSEQQYTLFVQCTYHAVSDVNEAYIEVSRNGITWDVLQYAQSVGPGSSLSGQDAYLLSNRPNYVRCSGIWSGEEKQITLPLHWTGTTLQKYCSLSWQTGCSRCGGSGCSACIPNIQGE